MKKVIVIGSPGAGKSTFARKLQKKTGLPLFYLDMIWHKPDQMTIDKDEFDKKLQEILQKNNWIIDGNYNRTIPLRLKSCDTVFLLDYPVEICLQGAKDRIGTSRPDLPWQETEFDPEFKQFILDFSKNQLPNIYRVLEEFGKDKKIIVFKSRAEANDYLIKLER